MMPYCEIWQVEERWGHIVRYGKLRKDGVILIMFYDGHIVKSIIIMFYSGHIVI
jgi:hypothetical protein